ncbi:transposase domain-containing protein [Bradyrhizobium japonicum]|uniref:transposase domain-containing protein n=1 Tax=Bradyrhizobium japonicum TaxID=375 RepID=UPI001E456D05|nr:transposase domain-containing protein [Bradyrhizobium japonicum]MCD9892068.1 transposase domain-containing protein [Bradyrhizobium japonicum]WRJ88553.1 transposase domain-containing protein [Bradyrhizobium japonicum]WRJ97539.1 transposase domain-containing protein [Bradyrhizobium japonicum]WRK51256.1 transposase domain-containing protein [Bradyrhizobium japonicum]
MTVALHVEQCCRARATDCRRGQRNWTFASSDDGGRRAADIYTLIADAKLNDIDPQDWLTDALARLPHHPARRIDELPRWNWRPQSVAHAA